MPSIAVVGVQWGDEGKGKVVDALTHEADVVVRYGGGANAGHTVIVGDSKFVLHLIPSGILHAGKRCVIGNGVVLDPDALATEKAELVSRGVAVTPETLLISDRAHVVMPYHVALDRFREARAGAKKIGTTGRGIGPCYTDKTARLGIRVGDLGRADVVRERLELSLAEKTPLLQDIAPDAIDMAKLTELCARWADALAPFTADTIGVLHDALDQGKKVLFEGAQGALLDVDFGTYPYVTSSNAGIGGLCAGTGIPPRKVGRVIGVAKAYATRVGSGPFATELHDALGERIRKVGQEFGATTGRPRRCGWFDIPAARYALRFCGVESICITKLDVLSGLDEVKICTSYDASGAPVLESLKGWQAPLTEARRERDLPVEARDYIAFLEEALATSVDFVSVGRRRDQLIARHGVHPWA